MNRATGRYLATAYATAVAAVAVYVYALTTPASGIEPWQDGLLAASVFVGCFLTHASALTLLSARQRTELAASGMAVLACDASWDVFHFLTSQNINTAQAVANTALAVATAALAGAGAGLLAGIDDQDVPA